MVELLLVELLLVVPVFVVFVFVITHLFFLLSKCSPLGHCCWLVEPILPPPVLPPLLLPVCPVLLPPPPLLDVPECFFADAKDGLYPIKSGMDTSKKTLNKAVKQCNLFSCKSSRSNSSRLLLSLCSLIGLT